MRRSNKPASQPLQDISRQRPLKYFNFISMLYITCLLAAVVVVYKVVSFGPFSLSEGTIIFPTTYLLGDVIAEVYGYQLSRKLIWFSLLCEILFVAFVTLIIKIPGASFWHHQAAYDLVLGKLYHVAIANVIGIPAGAFVNIYAISKWKILAKGRYFWFRSLCATALGELTLSIVAVFICMFEVVPLKHVFIIMASTYLFKLLFAAVSVYPAVIFMKILKKAENIDIYDLATRFNPFSLEVR